MERQMTYIIKLISHLDETHALIVESHKLRTLKTKEVKFCTLIHSISLDKQSCYCLREIFGVNNLRCKYNECSATPFIPSTVRCVLV